MERNAVSSTLGISFDTLVLPIVSTAGSSPIKLLEIAFAVIVIVAFYFLCYRLSTILRTCF